MRIVRRDEMRKIDGRAISEFNIPSLLLMENAGRGVAETIEEYMDPSGLSVLCACGKGNNGGDGFVVARHLANSGARVEILLMGKLADLKGDAQVNAKIAQSMGLEINEISTTDDLAVYREGLEDFGLIVDAVLGTGFSGKPKGQIAGAIELINSSLSFVASVDVPSGIEADGMVSEPELAVEADLTVTMAYLKPCHVLYPTRSYCGDVWTADIGIPNALLDREGRLKLMSTDEAALLVPERVEWGNKATFGKVLIVAGSRGMSGAARLAAMAAARTGAGLVYLGFPESMTDVFDATLLEAVKNPLADTGDGHLAAGAADEILAMADDVDVLAVGPGLGTHLETELMIKKILDDWKKPLIIDADGINALAEDPSILEGKKAPLILTPHPGEMARLINGDSKEIDRKRLDIAEEYAKKWSSVVVLKGAPTIVGCPAEVWVNSTGNSGLASGGTGDVLTGVITSLVAQGLPLTHAARLGVWLHGAAGDIAVEDTGEHSLVAGNLIDYLPEAFYALSEDDDEAYLEEFE